MTLGWTYLIALDDASILKLEATVTILSAVSQKVTQVQYPSRKVVSPISDQSL